MSKKSPIASSGSGSSATVTATRHRTNGNDGANFSKSLLVAILSFRDGDFSTRMPSDLTGVEGKIADAFNDIVIFSDRRARETVRVSSAVGKEGKLKQRMNGPTRFRRSTL
jgi:hypothetical protein